MGPRLLGRKAGAILYCGGYTKLDNESSNAHVQGVPSTSREFSRPSFLIPEVCAKIRPLKKLKNFLGGKFFALVSMR
jgi:hypothetical protein